ncbi:MAG TPA: hypothetical protein EYO59_01135, partial [Chromatiaceae bacterium]|nr:hypothetical protein [Chromatiaceae bacterium]
MTATTFYYTLLRWTLATLVGLITTACNVVDYATDGCSANKAKPLRDFPSGNGSTDVTFIAFGDSQFGGGANNKNSIQIAAINRFDQFLSWEDAGYPELGAINNVRGIVMAGDITQNGRDGRGFGDNEYSGFSDSY